MTSLSSYMFLVSAGCSRFSMGSQKLKQVQSVFDVYIRAVLG